MEFNPNFKNIFTFLFSFLLLSSPSLLTAFASISVKTKMGSESPYAYKEQTGKEPKNWGNLDPQWKACSNGRLQSPIDLAEQRAQVLPSLGELKLDYKPAPAVLKNRGHDIAVEWQGDAGNLVIDDTQYKLVNCHWHTPSEHTFKGTRYEQEVHMVHKSSAGGIAVIGILYKIGNPDTFLEKLLPDIKATKPEGSKDLMTVDPRDVINFRSDQKYYRYIGSLTTPPCTEGVIWTVLKKVRTASNEQIQALRDAVEDGFEANGRPIQEQNGRPLFLYRRQD